MQKIKKDIESNKNIGKQKSCLFPIMKYGDSSTRKYRICTTPLLTSYIASTISGTAQTILTNHKEERR